MSKRVHVTKLNQSVQRQTDRQTDGSTYKRMDGWTGIRIIGQTEFYMALEFNAISTARYSQLYHGGQCTYACVSRLSHTSADTTVFPSHSLR